jgi:protein gp37
MADLFGDWVPDEWINRVMEAIRESPQWTYIFLTKNPKRYLSLDFPDNAWIGATADTQERADAALEVFVFNYQNDITTFISCEPLLEPIQMKYMGAIDWLIIGGQSKSSGSPAFQPEWKWVENLLFDAREKGAAVYFKDNLMVKPEEYPE